MSARPVDGPEHPDRPHRRTLAGEDVVMDYSAEEPEVPAEPLEKLRSRHESRLLAIEGVLGTALGETFSSEPALIVYVLDQASAEQVPSELDGHPVLVTVTGEIRAQVEG